MPRGRIADVPRLVEGACAGDPRAVGRLISLVEEESLLLREASALLAPLAGRAHVVGVTGAPGVGKSTATSELVGAIRRSGRRVGVLAIDPTSPFSGGALLGDRIRMREHGTDPEVFVRSMASRGRLGGIAAATPQALRVLEAAGCEVVLVETVGVGQSEIEVAGLADTTLVLLAPGMGDGIQAAKAGILEVGDIYLINKADRDGASTVRREVRSMVSRIDRPAGAWSPPVLLTVASTGEGIDDLLERVDAHHGWLIEQGELAHRRLRRTRAEIEGIALGELRSRFARLRGGSRLTELAQCVVDGELDPFAAADALAEDAL